MAAWGYEFYLLVLKVSSLFVSLTREKYSQYSKVKFVFRSGHVISLIYKSNWADHKCSDWSKIYALFYGKTRSYIIGYLASYYELTGKLTLDYCLKKWWVLNWCWFLMHVLYSSYFVSKPRYREYTTSLPEVSRGDFASSLVWRVHPSVRGHFHQT